jgi:hypothetical protein
MCNEAEVMISKHCQCPVAVEHLCTFVVDNPELRW